MEHIMQLHWDNHSGMHARYIRKWTVTGQTQQTTILRSLARYILIWTVTGQTQQTTILRSLARYILIWTVTGLQTPSIKAVQAVHEEMNGRAYLYFRTGRLFVCRARTRARNGSPGLQNRTDKLFPSGDQNRNGGTVPVPFQSRSVPVHRFLHGQLPTL